MLASMHGRYRLTRRWTALQCVIGATGSGLGSLAAQTLDYARLDAAPTSDVIAAWDPGSQRVLALENTSIPEFWEWDGQAWARRIGPAPAAGGSAQFDPARRVFYAFGSSGIQEWNGARWSTRGSSVHLVGVPTTFDTARNRVLAWSNGLQEWTGSLWLSVASAGPSARGSVALAYDPVASRCVVYGGISNQGQALADCWFFDGIAWTQSSASAPPGPRVNATLHADPLGRRLVLFGGESGGSSTWTLQGSNWTRLPTTRDPGVRTAPTMVFDGQGTLLVGGSRPVDGTPWRLQGNDWQRLAPSAPISRDDSPWVWDPVRDEAVQFGGSLNLAGNVVLLQDTWTWSDRSGRPEWRELAPAHVPSARHGHGMAWSAIDGKVLLFGGAASFELDDTWSWDGVDWTLLATPVRPPARRSAVMTEDPRGGVLLYGGVRGAGAFADHWYWSGSGWRQELVWTPGERVAGLAALDPVRSRVVMLGGAAPVDAWEWDGVGWSPIVAPPGAVGVATQMAFRPETGRMMVETSTSRHEWDGSVWTSSSSGSNARRRLLTDLGRQRVLGWGGERFVGALTPTPAAATRFASGCSSGASPGLWTRGRPVPGNAGLAVVLGSRVTSTPALLAMGLTDAEVALGGGCVLRVGTILDARIGRVDASGNVAFAVPLPAVSSLRGVTVVAQGAVLDPVGGAFAGLSWTEGLRIQIGD